ncbi:MAG TPA: translocation/assembly module TamB domain-containing protein [Rhizomicrobium sp.]|nr:translocation/assembly module TamB domain-containing protein [Rhizomicrobium sp.]
MNPAIRKSLLIGGGAMGAAAMLLALIIVFGNTGMGRHSIEWLVPRLSGGQVTLKGLGGRFPENLRVSRLEVRDDKGLWLTADDVAVDWAPLAYLWNKIEIDNVTARQIDVLRRPVETSTSEGEGPHIEIAALKVDRLNVAEAVAWRKASITVAGKLDYASLNQARIDIAAQRLDGPGTYRVDLDISPEAISGSADIREPANGLIGGLADLPDLGPLSIQARASGPRNAQSMVLALRAGALSADARGLIDLVGKSLQVDIVANAPAMTPGPGLSWSSVALKAHASGAISKPNLDIRLRIADLKAEGGRAQMVRADIQGNGGHAAVDAEIDDPKWDGLADDFFAGGPIRLRANVVFDDPTRPVDFELAHTLATVRGHATFGEETKANATLQIHSLAPFAALAGLDLTGSMTAATAVDLKGGKTAAMLNGALDVTGGDETLSTLIGRNAKFAFGGAMEKGNIVFDHASVDGTFANISAKGGLEDGALRVDWTGALRDLKRVAGTLSGNLNLHGHVKGAVKNFELTVAGDGQIAGGTYAKGPVEIAARIGGLPDAPQGKASVNGRINGGALQMRATLAQRAGGLSIVVDKADWKSLRARADMLLAKGAKLPTGRITITDGELADLKPFLGMDVAGSLSASTDLRGGKEVSLALVNVGAKNLTVEGTRMDTLTLTGSVADPAGRAKTDLKLAVAGIETNGISGDAQAQIAGPLDAMDIRLSANLIDADGNDAKIQSSAKLDATKDVLALNVLEASYRGEAAHLVTPARIDLAKGVAVDKLQIEAAGATASVSGRISPSLDIIASVRNVTSRLVKLLAPDLDVSGVMSADAKLSGTLAAPRGTVSLHGTGLAFEGAAKGTEKGDLIATAVLNGKTADIDARLSAGKSLSLAVNGTAPILAGENMNLTVKGSTDLALLNPILNAQGQNLRGTVTLDGTVTGTQLQPRAEGTAILSGADFQDYVQGVHLSDIAAHIAAQGNKITLTDFKAKAGKGTIDAKGDIDLWTPGMPVSLAINANNARFIASNLITADGDATLKLAGEAGSHVNLIGDIRIDDGEVNLPESLPRNVAVLDVRRKGQKHAPPPERKGPVIGLGLTVTSPGRLFVRGRGLDAEVSGRVRVGGTTDEPDMRGAFNMRRGELSIAGQTLNFTSGKIGFDGAGVSRSLDPSLDFVAESTSGSVTAKLEITGYASAPKIKLSSSPYLPQDEVLAHLLFQQSVKELGPLQVAQIAEGLGSLTGIGSGLNPLSRVRKALGLDRLAVGSGQTGTGASVEAGKYVMNGVYVGAKQDTSGATTAKVQVDLTRRLKAQATVNTGTTANVTGSAAQVDRGSSVGLTYQFDY